MTCSLKGSDQDLKRWWSPEDYGVIARGDSVILTFNKSSSITFDRAEYHRLTAMDVPVQKVGMHESLQITICHLRQSICSSRKVTSHRFDMARTLLLLKQNLGPIGQLVDADNSPVSIALPAQAKFDRHTDSHMHQIKGNCLFPIQGKIKNDTAGHKMQTLVFKVLTIDLYPDTCRDFYVPRWQYRYDPGIAGTFPRSSIRISVIGSTLLARSV